VSIFFRLYLSVRGTIFKPVRFRRPILSRAYFDTQYPTDMEAKVDANGESEPSCKSIVYSSFSFTNC
jgi:hypothetical protein